MTGSEAPINVHHCQIQSCARISPAIVNIETIKLPIQNQVRLWIKRHVSIRIRKAVKRIFENGKVWWDPTTGTQKATIAVASHLVPLDLKPGDLVHVRTREEILRTLNSSNELKGCAFLTEMEPYCTTTQRVYKLVERFVDERDYKVKKARGIVLLEDVRCNGTDFYGKCDRSCFFFWRIEWLKKIE